MGHTLTSTTGSTPCVPFLSLTDEASERVFAAVTNTMRGAPPDALVLAALCLSGSLAGPARPKGQHHAQGDVHRHKGGVRDTGYFFSTQDYGPGNRRDAHGRKLTSSTWSPMRLTVQYTSTDALSSAQDSLLRNNIIPEMAAWISNTLSVQPLATNLLIDRFCSAKFSGGTCYSLGSTTCGLNADGTDFPVPDNMLAAKETCANCYSSGQCDGCTQHAAGSGVADTDFVLFVGAIQAESCTGGGDTLAYATTCERDQYDRPIMGFANFCPSKLKTSPSDYDGLLATAIHEMIHALGFSSGSWPLFRNADGTPVTPREPDGLPATVPVTCVDGTEKDTLAISSSTLLLADSSRGTRVNKLVSPRTLAIARDHFGCPTLDGVELENQPTGSGCYGSHFEQRLFMYEVMAPVGAGFSVYSALTLALMEDTGWYKANYSIAEYGLLSEPNPRHCRTRCSCADRSTVLCAAGPSTGEGIRVVRLSPKSASLPLEGPNTASVILLRRTGAPPTARRRPTALSSLTVATSHLRTNTLLTLYEAAAYRRPTSVRILCPTATACAPTQPTCQGQMSVERVIATTRTALSTPSSTTAT